MKAHLLIYLSLLIVQLAHAQAPAGNKAVTALHDQWRKELTAASNPIHDRFKAALEKLKTAATKAGNLDEANAAEAELEQLAAYRAQLLPTPPATRLFVGGKKWNVGAGTLVSFERNGTGTRTWGGDSKTFVWNLAADGVVEVSGIIPTQKQMQTLYFKFTSDKTGTFSQNRALIDNPVSR